MSGRGSSKRDAHPGELAALRSVLIATGGQAKLEELYRVLNADEAARFLGVSESQVRHLTCRRELPCIKTGKRGVGYRLIDLIEWQETRVLWATG
jgi:predicted DNA-binding transcriptional regulator AlpA